MSVFTTIVHLISGQHLDIKHIEHRLEHGLSFLKIITAIEKFFYKK